MLSLREAKKEKCRRAIAQAALELFESKGFDGTTMDEIAKKAGVSRPTVFNYFPHKEDTLSLIGEINQERVGEQIKEMLAAGVFSDPLTALQRIILVMGETFAEYPNSARIFHGLRMQEGRRGRREIPEAVDEQRGFVKLLIESAQGRGEVRADYTSDELTDHLMIGLFAAAIGPWLNGAYADQPLSRVVERHFALYVQGFRAQ